MCILSAQIIRIKRKLSWRINTLHAIEKLRKFTTIEKSVQHQHNPLGNKINLSKFSFSKNLYRLLNQTLGLYQQVKYELKYYLIILKQCFSKKNAERRTP